MVESGITTPMSPMAATNCRKISAKSKDQRSEASIGAQKFVESASMKQKLNKMYLKRRILLKFERSPDSLRQNWTEMTRRILGTGEREWNKNSGEIENRLREGLW
jgi:hypothetical protein